MRNFVKLFSVVAFITFSNALVAQTKESDCVPVSTSISGVYQSENLKLTFPHPTGIRKISLNGVEIKKEIQKEFEIDLSQLIPDDAYVVEIFYCETGELPYHIITSSPEK